MKFFSLIYFLFLFSVASFAQCPTEDYYIFNQSQIDDFTTNFPGCTNPPFSVIIQGNGVTNLNGLSEIVTVGENFRIKSCDNITELSGLLGLTSVSGILDISNNENLTSLNGIDNLQTVGDNIFLAGNDLLASLDGLSSLATVGGYLDIQVANITDLSGLENLTSLGGYLGLVDLPELINTNALLGLSSIDGTIYIWRNNKLSNLDGLLNISSINGFLSIIENAVLSDISGLQNIDAASINNSNGSELIFYDNFMLSLCEIQSVCDFLDLAASDTGLTTYIQNNGSGCNSETEIDAACDNCTPPSVTFSALADLCVDGTFETGLAGGTPAGGVYSGPGVSDNGDDTYDFISAAAGIGIHTLTYTFTDNDGCMGSASDDVEIFDLPTVTYTAPADICVDRDVQTGLGGATPVGGIYSGSGVTDDGNGMTYSFDPAAAAVGVHTLTYDYTDSNGCMNSSSDDVEVFDLPTVIFTAPADLCIDAGVQTGLGGATPTGGVYTGSGITDDANGVTYSFDPAAAGVGVHTLTYYYTDDNGCMNSSSDDVEVFEGLNITSTPTPTTCDLDNGAVEFTINQGTEPVTYTDNGIAITTFTDLSPGNYVWDAEDANGCTFQVSFYILFSDKLDVEITSTTTTTCGLDNGSLSYSVIDGLAPITFTEAGSPVDINQLPEGLHTYVATDANGCTQTLSTIGIGSSDPLVSVAQPHATTCGVADNGWVEIFTVTGTDPVTYTENGVVMSLTDLTPGDYNWDTEDATGCTGQVSFTIEDSEVFEVTAGNPSGTITTRCNEDNGVVWLYQNGQPGPVIDIADSNGPITYQKNCFYLAPSGKACIVSELPAGMYNWTCTDGNGCVDQVSFTVEESDPLDITASPTATSCDLANGEVSFTVNTGTEPITYSENGTSITSFTDLAAGDYSWDAEDADGCLFVVDFTIDPSIEATFTTTPTHTFCDGNNGSVTATMTSGTDFLTYTLNGFVNTTGVYNNLAPGTYTMTAVDNVFCPASSTFTINGSDPLEISTVVTPTFCNEDNGSITATLDSGTAPVNYTIAGQGTNTSGTFTDLAPGTYTMNAVDAVGCAATETFTIAPSVPLDINTVIVHPTCELDNGSVTATLMSGTTPVTFTIAGEGSNTTGEFDELAPGNYTMNAEDAQGCEATVSFVIDDSTLPLFDMETVRSSCGDENGSIQLTPDVNTGRAPYEYNIGGAWTAETTFDDLNPGNYTVTIRDADGCTTSQATTILDSEQLVFINHIDHADCGNISGVITLITLQGTGPFLYTISNDYLHHQNDSGIFAFLEVGQYTATIISADGCVVTQELIVKNDPGVRLDVEVTHPECGKTNGSILFHIGQTGTMPYQLYINDNLLEDNLYNEYLISDLENGEYKIEIYDYYGCSDSSNIVIDDGNSIIEAFEIDPIACDGTLGKVSAIYGEGEYTFTLNGVTQPSGNFDGLNTGEYTMYATDSMGCDIEKDFTIESFEFTKMGVEIFPNRCGDLADIGISVNGGLAPYTYYLNDQFQGSRFISNLEIGEYEVKVIDSNGCELIEIVTITGETELSYEVVRCQEIGPKGFGYIVLEAIGGTTPYRYQLGQYYNNHGRFSGLEESGWLLTITDANGCELQEVVTICETGTQSQKIASRSSFSGAAEIGIYPNPARNLLNIEYKTALDQTLYIYNINGNKIHSQSIYKDTHIHSIDIQPWPSGVYYIKIANSPTSYRFVKID